MNPLMHTFFDALADGVVIVNPQGVVQYANGVGLRLFKPTKGQPFPDAKVRKALQDLVAGYIKPPVRVAVNESAATFQSQAASIMPLPIPNTYAITLHDVQEKTFYETTLKNFFDFVTMDLAEPIGRFASNLESLTQAPPDSLSEHDRARLLAAVADARDVGVCLQRMQALSQLFKTALLVDQERLPIVAMIKEVLDAEGKLIAARKLRIHLDGLEQELPPVYGSRIWLTRAIRELVANGARYSPAESQLEIALKCTGTHVILYFRNHGLFNSRQLAQKPVFVPFHMVAEYMKEKKMPARAMVGKRIEDPLPAGPGLGLPMCQRILGLHGGTIVHRHNDEGSVEFTLEIPTGAPSQGDEALDIQQAQRYARDMATIMQRMRKKKGDTPPNA